MKLKSLTIKDFRSIDGEVNVSLEAPIVLIHGPNGAGKTSLLAGIELALTGAVPSLSRADPDYLSFLPHKDKPFGSIRLELEEDDGAVRTGEVRVTTSGIEGTPLLSPGDAEFFSERSYLAQSTLGRLLELYQHSEKKGDSHLTRFVKEILGLDRMEAVLNGLSSALHISRLKDPVPGYNANREAIALEESRLKAQAQQLEVLRERIVTLDATLRQRLAGIYPALDEPVLDLQAIARKLAEDPDEVALADLVRARREVVVAEASLFELNSGPQGAARESVEASNRMAAVGFETWTASKGASVDALLERASALLAEGPDTATGYVDRAAALTSRLSADKLRIQGVLEAHDQAVQRGLDLQGHLDAARTRLARLDEQSSAGLDANEALAKSLFDITTHIHDDVCPVCDRDFKEVSQTPLAAHVAAKVSAIVDNAGRLQALARDRTTTSATIAALERQLGAAQAEVLAGEMLTGLKSRAANLDEVLTQLADAAADLAEGDRLRDRAVQSARSVVALQNTDQSAVVIRSNLEALSTRVGLVLDTTVSTADLVEALKKTIADREHALTERQTERRLALDTVGALRSSSAERLRLEAQQQATSQSIEDAKRKKREGDALIEAAKDLVRQTRDVRAHVVQRVFNEELNAIWRDLFVRLAPEEPFIPAFAIPDASSGEIEAVLETHYRRGGKGGNPRAMLSAGNLNTAALTLFLALHLSGKPKLPWLVIDDPVQSMDEVHIAQFAALLRTLSKKMGRQVIVAVHERSLFDYLTLELSPAFEGDRLNVIELARNAVGQTTGRWDPRIFVPDGLIAA